MITTSQLDIDPRIKKEALSLSKSGIEVDVLAYDSSGNEKVFHVYNVSSGLRHLLIKPLFQWASLNRFFQYEFFEFAKKKNQYGAVHANDLTSLLSGWCISRKLGIPLIYDAHEMWSENVVYVNGKYVPMSFFWKFFFRNFESFMLKYIELLITVGKSINDEYLKRHNLNTPPLFLPNVPELKVFQDFSSNDIPSIRDLCNLSDKYFITAYIGGVNPLRNIEKVIEAHQYLPEECVFVIRGPGIEYYKHEYMNLSASYDIEDRIFTLEPVEQNQMLSAGKGADCGIVMLRNICKNFYWFYPNKFFEYMAMKLPVAVSNFPDVSAYINKYNCGVTFDPENAKDIADKIMYLYENKKQAREMADNGYQSILKENNWEYFEKDFIKAYKNILCIE